MLEATVVAERIASHSRDDFERDPVLRFAADTVISRIGESAKLLSEDAIAAMPSIPWQEVRGMRNRLQHASMVTDYRIVWNVITTEMPKVNAAITAYRATI